MTYLRNVWYIAAWSDELDDDRPMGRTICEEPIVLFRDADGRVAALLDRCPHRFAPLSYGTLRDGQLECRYHGLRFDQTGQCVLNPHGPVRHNARTRAYAAEEAHKAIWIWMGDPAEADPTKIPDLSFIDRALPTAFNKGYLNFQANYLVLLDNILDLSHIDFLHPTTLGGGGKDGQGTATGSKVEVETRDLSVLVRWVNPNAVPSPMEVATMLLKDGTPIRRTLEVEWRPATVILLNSIAEVSEGQGRKRQQLENIHVITPETAKTAHYFFACTRDFAQEDGRLNGSIAAGRKMVFETEDGWLCKAIQERMGDSDFWDLGPVLMATDAAAVRVRRALQGYIDAEQEGAKGPQPGEDLAR